MKNTLKYTAVVAVLALVMSACGGDPVKPTPDSSNDPKERVVVYKVGNTESRQTLETEGEWDALIEVLCDQAQNGNKVSFFNLSQKTYLQDKGAGGTKAAKTFSTSNRDEMKAWMKEMEKEGRTVVVTYNNGTWNGMAYASAPSADVTALIIGTWHFNCMVRDHIGPDGLLQSSDLYAPEDGGGSMYYTFCDDGVMTMTFNSVDGTSLTEQSTWTITSEGKLCSDLLLNVSCWDVNWISDSTLILSTSELGTDEEENVLYQMQFDKQ